MKLELDRCELGQECLSEMCSALRVNTALNALDLSNNVLGDGKSLGTL